MPNMLQKPLAARLLCSLTLVAVAAVAAAPAVKRDRDDGADAFADRVASSPLGERPAADMKPLIPVEELEPARKWCQRALALKTAADTRIAPKDVVVYGRGGAYSCQQVFDAP